MDQDYREGSMTAAAEDERLQRSALLVQEDDLAETRFRLQSELFR